MAEEPIIHVLLIEDDDRLASLTARYLESHGVVVSRESNGVRGLAAALHTRYDVILLDLMLPGMNGLDVCRELRTRRDVPLIMLTARGEEADRVMGLELGADDYVTKPFSSRELLARIRAQARRQRGQAGPATKTLHVGPFTIDPQRFEATMEGRDLALTPYEFALLRVLVERAGTVLNREQLMDLARGNAEDAFDRSIDVHISKLRNKLGDDSRNPRFLKTVRGVGYMLVAGER